jgi:hypothetical protein
MAEPKRGSVEAFRAAEERRKARVASKGKFKIFGKAGSFDSAKKAEAKRKFNEKAAAVNKKRINQESVKKFKAAEERRQVRLKEKNPNNKVISKKVTKRLQANENKKRAQADVEKDLPKSKIDTTTAKTVGTAVGAGATKTKPVAKTPPAADTPKPAKAIGSFGEAFKKARAKGVGTKFAYNDKMYSAVTRDDISRAGKTSLQDFLNSTKRKDTKIAKAPGQIIKKKRGGGVDVEKAKEFRKNRKTPIRTFVKNTLEGKYMDKTRGTAEPLNFEKYKRIKRQEGGMAEISREDLKRLRDQLMERRGQNPMTPLPRRPRPKTPGSPGRPLPRIPKKLREQERRQGNSPRQFQTPGAAVSDREMKSLMEQMSKAPVQDRMKTGGSVMARGCKLGRKKPTKMY